MAKLQLGKYHRVVVIGDPYWPKEGWHAIKDRLESLQQETSKPILVITTEAQGVATLADLAAHLLGYKTKVVKGEWKRYGARTAPIRNLRILEQFKPNQIIVFHNGKLDADLKHCMRTARTRKIPVDHLMMI